MSTKKQFIELVEFLESNKDKKVLTIMSTIKLMTESKKVNQTIVYDKANKAYAIFCYYHKVWELVSEVEYGAKASSKSGLNTMCKIGTNHWTKQQSTAKKSKDQLLSDVTAGKVEPKLMKDKLAEIETTRVTINKEKQPKHSIEMPVAKTT